MLVINVPPFEVWDESSSRFISSGKETKLVLEHSLVSISKWEQKWKRAYLSEKKMTPEEVLDYIKCMTISQNIDDAVYVGLSPENIRDIKEYIEDPMSATVIDGGLTAQQTYRKEVITSEYIYYLMLANNVPVEFQKWHLNRLLTLLRVCAVKNAPPKKMGKRETMANYAALNKARRAAHHTKG